MTVAPGVYSLDTLIGMLTGFNQTDSLALCASCIVNGDPHRDMTNPQVKCWNGTVTLSLEADYTPPGGVLLAPPAVAFSLQQNNLFFDREGL